MFYSNRNDHTTNSKRGRQQLQLSLAQMKHGQDCLNPLKYMWPNQLDFSCPLSLNHRTVYSQIRYC